MTDEQVCETVEKYGANQEECARLNASLSCLRNVHMSGERAGVCTPVPSMSATVLQCPVSGVRSRAKVGLGLVAQRHCWI